MSYQGPQMTPTKSPPISAVINSVLYSPMNTPNKGAAYAPTEVMGGQAHQQFNAAPQLGYSVGHQQAPRGAARQYGGGHLWEPGTSVIPNLGGTGNGGRPPGGSEMPMWGGGFSVMSGAPQQQQPPMAPPPQPKPQGFVQVMQKSNRICRHFLQGKCTWGPSCRFSHDLANGAMPNQGGFANPQQAPPQQRGGYLPQQSAPQSFYPMNSNDPSVLQPSVLNNFSLNRPAKLMDGLLQTGALDIPHPFSHPSNAGDMQVLQPHQLMEPQQLAASDGGSSGEKKADTPSRYSHNPYLSTPEQSPEQNPSLANLADMPAMGPTVAQAEHQ